MATELDRTAHAWSRVTKWSAKRDEFGKRARAALVGFPRCGGAMGGQGCISIFDEAREAMNQTGDLKIAAKGDCEIEIARGFNAPRHLVFAAYTNPELV